VGERDGVKVSVGLGVSVGYRVGVIVGVNNAIAACVLAIAV